jgi:Arc/MetJ family transcription regulator
MHNRLHVRTTLNLDDDLIREAGRLTGLRAKTDVIHEGLRALITRESARRLSALGGKLPSARAPRRRRTIAR